MELRSIIKCASFFLNSSCFKTTFPCNGDGVHDRLVVGFTPAYAIELKMHIPDLILKLYVFVLFCELFPLQHVTHSLAKAIERTNNLSIFF